MSFFEEQSRARRNSARLAVLYACALAAIVAAVNLAAYPVVAWYRGAPPSGANIAWISAITLAVIALGTLEVLAHLAQGEEAIARMLHGRRADYGAAGTPERRLANVVEEMAIASGLAAPRTYVLPREASINAFAAGRSVNQAIIVVTQGALERLSRDELQGVIAHEFSHILNGDLRVNLRALCALQGILFLSEIGRYMMRYYSGYGTEDGRRYFMLPLAVLGAGVFVAGAVGLCAARLIQAALAREREFLADACAVQYTRNADGLCGALARIHADAEAARMLNWHADALGHMLFAPGVKQWLGGRLATHPPIRERIARANPQASLALYLERLRRAPRPAPPPEVLPMASRPVPIAPPRLTGVTALIAAIGQPTPEHLEYASGLLAYLPSSLRETLADADGAQALMLGTLIDAQHSARGPQMDALGALGIAELARRAEVLSPLIHKLDRAYRLPLIALAIPVLRQLDTGARTSFLAALRAAIQADRRMTLDEFVLYTILDWNLGPRADRAGEVRYRSCAELATECGCVLSLLAHAGAGAAGDPAAAYAAGATRLGTAVPALLPVARLQMSEVNEGLERLALLEPLARAVLLEACHAVAGADANLRLIELELVRAVAAAIDCPMPPLLAAADPRLLKR